MTPDDTPGSGQLPDVERELARRGLRLRFDTPWLERMFQERQREEARAHNRIAISFLTLLFDAFVLGDMKAAPEIVSLSLVLRFAVQTPLTLLFVLLDRRRKTNPWSGIAACLLIVLPTLLVTVQAAHTTSVAAVQNVQAIPLIQLTAITSRISLAQAGMVCAASTFLYGWIVLTDSFVPREMIPSLLLVCIAISVAVFVFARRLDQRDRQVFLLNLQAGIGRQILADQNRRLARLTHLDPLTGIGNRRCFDTALAAIWADERQRLGQVALVLFDIDCFKQFNDCFGHQSGDDCLAAVARAVTGCLREDRDVLARYGGEEFVIILPETGVAEAWSVAERVRLAVVALAIPHATGGVADHVTVSLGVAAVVPAAQSAEALIEMADRCLYDAKRGGRNRIMADGFCPAALSAEALLLASGFLRTPLHGDTDTAMSNRH